MKSTVILVVDDEKVGPILRLLNRLGEFDARVHPIIDDTPKLDGPASPRDPAKKSTKVANQNPKKSTFRRGELKSLLLDALKQGPARPAEIAKRAGADTKQMTNAVYNALKTGDVVRNGKVYALKEVANG